MKTTGVREENLKKLFWQRQMASLSELKEWLCTTATMTVFRFLRRLGYVSSYSHRGGFYTLREIPTYDRLGLWCCGGVHFSRHGNLLCTAKALIGQSACGFTAAELAPLLGVEVKHALLELTRRAGLVREVIHGRHVYFSIDADTHCRQRLMRNQCEAAEVLAAGVDPTALADELKAGIVLLYSLLDERQRRLYAGLEAARIGHGGDRKIAALLCLDPHTVAKGRRELLAGRIDPARVRSPGGGRKPVEKKRPRSSPG
jgi:hypothetical protein